jgi:DNA-nicking Smr family endonuclease
VPEGIVLARLDRLLARMLGRAARSLPAGVPVIDLHGLGVKDALAATERFLRESAERGIPEVRIVYGKGRGSPGGRGILCEVIPRWLAAEGRRYVTSATPEPDASGADGAIRVHLFSQRSRRGGDP